MNVSQDLLDRETASIPYDVPMEVKASLSTQYVGMLQSTLRLLVTNEMKTSKSAKEKLVNFIVSGDGVRVFTEKHSVFQSIVFWQKDVFNSYTMNVQGEVHIQLNIIELIAFFGCLPKQVENAARVQMFVLTTDHLVLQMNGPKFRSRMRLAPYKDGDCGGVFDFNNSKTCLFVVTKPSILTPTFKSIDWENAFLTFSASTKTLEISSESTGSSFVTRYPSDSFERYESYTNIKAKFASTKY